MYPTFNPACALRKQIGQNDTTTQNHLFIVASNQLIAGALKQSANPGITAEVLSRDQLRNSTGLAVCDRTNCIFLFDESTFPGWTHQHLRLVSCRFPLSKKIIIGEEFSIEHSFSWLLEGIHGFLRYDEVERDLNNAVLAVVNGRLWIKPERLEQVCIYMQRTWKMNKQTAFSFTQRQKQVIDMVQRKLSNKQIANQLGISENTVKFHLAKVFSKLGTHDRNSVTEILRFPEK
jgi:DNA-binding CsgD family transcriptional regulator